MFSLYSLEGQGNIFNDLEFMRGALFERKHWLLSKLTFWPLNILLVSRKILSFLRFRLWPFYYNIVCKEKLGECFL